MASPKKGNKIGNNNQEEKKEDDSDYGIEDFDNESVRSSKKIASMSEDEYYPKDNDVIDGDDQTGIRSLSTTTTERDSCSQVDPVTGTQPISTRQEVEIGATELDSKFSSYDDDFADYDSMGEPPQREAPTGSDGANSGIKHRGDEPANPSPISCHPPSDQSLMGKPTDGSDSYASDMDWFGSDHDVGDHEGRLIEGSKVTHHNDGIRVNADDAVLDQRFGGANPSFDSSLVKDPREKQPVVMEGETMGRRVTEEKATVDDGGGCGTDKQLEMLKRQVDAARTVLISSLGGDDDNRERSLLELVLLAESRSCKTIAENDETTNRATAKVKLSTKKSSKTAVSVSLRVESAARAELEKRVESLERDLSRAKQESRMQSRRAVSLKRRLDSIEVGHDDVIDGRPITIGDDYHNSPEAVVTADIVALKHKVIQLVERLRQEKYVRLKSEHEVLKSRQKPKIQMLSNHIEKLMVFLKHEATQRAKAHEQQRRLQKELGLVKARNSALMRSNQAKDRATVELREGSKILEDQLRLMDEKYMELRTKLDWTRTKAEKDVRKARAQASALRSKWALLCGGGKMGAFPLLDSAKADAGTPLRTTASVPETTSKEGRGAVSDGVSGFIEVARKSKQQQQQQRDHRVQFNGVPSQSGGDRGYSSPTADDNRRPESDENGGFHSRRREKTVGMVPSMSAPSLFSKHQNPHGQQQRYNASIGGFGGVGAGEKGKGEGYTRQQFQALSNSVRTGGSNYPDTRVATGCPGGGEKSSGGGVSGSAAGNRLPLGGGRERDGGGGDGGGRGASELLYA